MGLNLNVALTAQPGLTVLDSYKAVFISIM